MRGDTDWTTIYIVILAIIAALLIFGVAKPMFSGGGFIGP
jgi:hypothetical protein